MRKFKRIASGLLAATIAMSMVACSGNNSESGSENNGEQGKQEEIKPYREAMADMVDAVQVAEFTENYEKTYYFVDKDLKVHKFENCGYMEPQFENGRNNVYIGLSTHRLNKNAVISLDNNVILQYDRMADLFVDNRIYYKVQKDDKYGVVDKDGKIIYEDMVNCKEYFVLM